MEPFITENSEFKLYNKSRLIFITGTMFAGKSQKLIEKVKFLISKNGKQSVYIFTYYQSRYHTGIDLYIHSRALEENQKIKADQSFGKSKLDLLKLPRKTNHKINILIDEAQFLTKQQVNQLVQYTLDNRGNVYAYGLRNDFNGNLFHGTQHLLMHADKINIIESKCACGQNANFHLKEKSDLNKIKAPYTKCCWICLNNHQNK